MLTHVANVNAGSPNVFVEGLAVARIGDSADSGNMTSGSGNVFANGLDNRYKYYRYGNIRFTNTE